MSHSVMIFVMYVILKTVYPAQVDLIQQCFEKKNKKKLYIVKRIISSCIAKTVISKPE